MKERIVKSAVPETGPEAAALLSQLNAELIQSNQVLQMKLSEVSQALSSTARKLQESEVEKETNRLLLENILESLSSGVIVLDLEGRISLFNQAAQKITGYGQSDVLGKKYSEIFSESARQNSPLVTLKEGKVFTHQERQITGKNKEKLSIGFSTSPVRDSGGKLLGVVEVFADLSKVKKLEEEIARVKTLAAVGEMAATASHDIRSPLSGIAGFADLLDKAIPAGDSRKKYIAKILEGLETVNKTLERLMDFVKPVKLAPREVRLTEFLDGITELFEMNLTRQKRDIKIERHYLKPDLTARIDPEQFGTVITNLLQNASQALADGGRIDVTVDEVKTGPEEMIYFKVADNGPGIPPEVSHKIFTPFFTSKEGGTGLGLANVKRIIEAHRGEVKIKSEVGKGTEVEIWVPRE